MVEVGQGVQEVGDRVVGGGGWSFGQEGREEGGAVRRLRGLGQILWPWGHYRDFGFGSELGRDEIYAGTGVSPMPGTGCESQGTQRSPVPFLPPCLSLPCSRAGCSSGLSH